MHKNPVAGKTLRWTFDNGPMGGKTFQHAFGDDGVVTWASVEGKKVGRANTEAQYHADELTDEVCAVSYLASSGYTLTVVLDFESNACLAFASNEKTLTMQKGKFEVVPDRDGAEKKHARAPQAHRSH